MECIAETQNIPVMLPACFPVIIPVVENDEQINEMELLEVIQINDPVYTESIKENTTAPVTSEPVTGIDKVLSCLMMGETFKDMTGSLNAVCAETVLTIDESGIKSKMVDTANVAMVDLAISQDVFDVFKLTEPVKIGIDVKQIYNLRTQIKKGSMVLLEVNKRTEPARHGIDRDGKENTIDEEIEYRYSISIEGTTTNLTALDINTIRKEPRPPVIELNTHVDITAGDFIQGVKDGGKIADKIALVFDQGSFSMVFEGSTSTMNKTVPVLSYATKDPKVRSLFSLDYIKDMIKVLNKKEIIRINMGNNHPMKLTRGSFGTETVFLLAPRIEAD
jgi:proliferating cell nuclear antigen